ncbi:serine/threonine-protein kinase [Actinoplanes sp. Pm04-4]|uniref:non-specific serine/threonine protein kinase n=1 Tax=Paractinoplanes pyxinae TaxID=2997416 RepID=A0ABT4AY58_9ACTN|nr:serine/threonine-protein kinase [Actinoplanes pyxinae]
MTQGQARLAVLDALRAAHREGILHRDVKPANILLDGDRVVLTDFGIAAIDDATALTATGQLVGSPSYLAPERINGKPATTAGDLWALGVTLYAALTGTSPFQREDTQATFAAVLTSRPTPPAYGGKVWPVIKGLLEKDPARRLTADQARPLLAAVAALPPQKPRRKPTSDTVVAPSDTVAAPTEAQRADGPTATAHTVLLPLRARSRTVGIAAGVAVVVLLAGGIAWAAGRSGGDTPAAVPSPSRPAPPSSSKPAPKKTNPLLDDCLVGRWRQTTIEVVNHFEGVDSRFIGGRGVLMRIFPDGRVLTDWNKSGPLTATIKGARYVETFRGTETGRVRTRNGRIYSSEIRGSRTLTITRNGRTVMDKRIESVGGDLPYLCSDTTLISYGNRDVSTDTYERISRTP